MSMSKIKSMKFKLILVLLCFTTALVAQSKRAYKKEICAFRDAHKAEFLNKERSPFYNDKKGLKAMKFFKPNKNYRVQCTFEATPDSKPFEMPTYSGKLKPYRQYGILTFTLNGKEETLAVYQSLFLIKMPMYKDHLFLPFKDLTSNESTYGGGRYIDLKLADVQASPIHIDFNRCYNPWCAYSEGFNCPIPPKENHLEIAILAGEKKYGKEPKHH